MPKLTDKQIAKVKAIAQKDCDVSDDVAIGKAFENPTDKKLLKAARKELVRSLAAIDKILAIVAPAKEKEGADDK